MTSAISAVILYHSIDISFVENATCKAGGSWSYCFFDEGEVWDSETYTALITNFYTTIITFLAIILSIISVVAFFVIRETAKGHAEDHIEKEIQKAIDKDRLTLLLQKIIDEDATKIALENILNDKLDPFQRKNQVLTDRLDEVIAALDEEGIEVRSNTLGASDA